MIPHGVIARIGLTRKPSSDYAQIVRESRNPRASCTQTRNPQPLWGGTGLRGPLTDPTNGNPIYPGFSGDREMPYLVAPGITPSPGIAMNYLTPTTQYTAQYNILIPPSKPAGKHLRIVLTWNSCPSRTDHKNYLPDLDLIFIGNYSNYLWSSSWNGNIEIVDVPASQVSTGRTYPALVQMSINRIPPPGTAINNGNMNYAIAWTWVKDHADHVP